MGGCEGKRRERRGVEAVGERRGRYGGAGAATSAREVGLPGGKGARMAGRLGVQGTDVRVLTFHRGGVRPPVVLSAAVGGATARGHGRHSGALSLARRARCTSSARAAGFPAGNGLVTRA